MNSAGIVIAFHGCDAVTRDAVLTGEIAQLSPSSNSYDWLGDGLYFFEGDSTRAFLFAEAASENPTLSYTRRPIANPAVLGAVIRMENWLDMSTQEGIDAYRSALAKLSDEYAAKKRSLPKNEKVTPTDVDVILRRLDREVLNRACELFQDKGVDIQAVRAPFAQGARLADDCEFTERAHVQIALRHMDAVIGWFLPAGDRMLTDAERKDAKKAQQALEKVVRDAKKRIKGTV